MKTFKMFSGLVFVGKEYLSFQCFLRKHGEMPPVFSLGPIGDSKRGIVLARGTGSCT